MPLETFDRLFNDPTTWAVYASGQAVGTLTKVGLKNGGVGLRLGNEVRDLLSSLVRSNLRTWCRFRGGLWDLSSSEKGVLECRVLRHLLHASSDCRCLGDKFLARSCGSSRSLSSSRRRSALAASDLAFARFARRRRKSSSVKPRASSINSPPWMRHSSNVFSMTPAIQAREPGSAASGVGALTGRAFGTARRRR